VITAFGKFATRIIDLIKVQKLSFCLNPDFHDWLDWPDYL